MVSEEISKDILINRLKKIEGQARGIQKMIENGRECEDILTQLVAIRSAVESVGALVLQNSMHFCFIRREGVQEPADIKSLARALAIWARIHIGE